MTNAASLQLPNAEELLVILSEKIAPILQPNSALVGIQSGGVWILQRLMTLLADPISTFSIEQGVLDVSFYRDDYAKRGLKSKVQPSQIPFDVENKHIILIDDVFFTGRTTRAAMNELFDYGRPASITLAALVNRGGRELPIMPQITAYNMALSADHHLQLSKNTDGTLFLNQTKMPLSNLTLSNP